MLLTNIFNYFTGFLTKKDGQAMVEYVLLVGLISIAAIATILLIGPQILAKFDEVLTALS